jgi:glycosidase
MNFEQKRFLHGVYFPEGLLYSEEAYRRFDMAGIAHGGGPGQVMLARALADRINQQRDFSRPDARPARAGELLSISLLNDIFRHLLAIYCEDVHPRALDEALDWSRTQAAPETVERPLPAFATLYPPAPVRAGRQQAGQYLAGNTGAWSNRAITLAELCLLHLSMQNRALIPYRELFDDTALRTQAPYEPLIDLLDRYFDTLPPFPGTAMPLLALLRAPLRDSPDSLEGQLSYIRRYWRAFLPTDLLEQLEIAQGVLQEETAMRGLGPGPLQVLEFGLLDEQGYAETEAFSIDKDWMPNLVLIAKTVYVWLDQLSRQYQRPINRLDEIPDEALDQLAGWGFTGLWLIGLWERSPASRTIKQRMGNPEAVSSAYSLFDYIIAEDLGGEAAYRDLAARAWRRGIRLASDMVPNHVGIYSRWVIEHPEWFIQLDQPPYPGYRFTGPDLSSDSRVGLYIEDGYWNHSDAAVVFKRVDHWTGHTRYLYHGNDGTSMPWNDTAQLDFTLPEVRQAVSDTILHVARMFSIIRFDAAMTLAKRHYQRLWFPRPGDGGAIPSRAEHGMSKAEFDRVFPAEFWREVVDRIAAEAPDTLLLAEAFWLMEGYFVRTLGMHRVYNSAFMNMLKMEDNAKYRQTIKNVLEFSPEVLQRFVNFMNNPDEDTAEAQFGRGDKYTGVAMMLATMPGLPMFGHGQIEGYREKYGMEYRRAYWDETPDAELIARHEREIFPLIRRRHLFSGARNFAFFDFVTPEGWVDENVFAYSNRYDGERALIVYNNRYNTTQGVLHTSTAVNKGPADAPHLRRIELPEALGLNLDEDCYYIFRDYRTGLEYLRYARDLARYGLHLELHAYQYQALLDWREIHDLDHSWGRLHGLLAGQGVPSVEEAYLEMSLASILEPFRTLLENATLWQLAAEGEAVDIELFRTQYAELLNAIAARLGREVDPAPIIEETEAELERLHRLPDLLEESPLFDETRAFLLDGAPAAGKAKEKELPEGLDRILPVWSLTRRLGALAAPAGDRNGFDVSAVSAAWMREWFLVKPIARAFEAMNGDAWQAKLDARLVRLCVAYAGRLPFLQTEPWAPTLDLLIHDPDTRAFLGVNRFGGRTWFNEERFEGLLHTLYWALCLDKWPPDSAAVERIALCLEDIRELTAAAEDAGYDLDRMFDSLK